MFHQGSAKRWKKFTDSECPEKDKFPGEWKNKNSLQKLCMMRALRPDRMTYALMYVIRRGHDQFNFAYACMCMIMRITLQVVC